MAKEKISSSEPEELRHLTSYFILRTGSEIRNRHKLASGVVAQVSKFSAKFRNTISINMYFGLLEILRIVSWF